MDLRLVWEGREMPVLPAELQWWKAADIVYSYEDIKFMDSKGISFNDGCNTVIFAEAAKHWKNENSFPSVVGGRCTIADPPYANFYMGDQNIVITFLDKKALLDFMGQLHSYHLWLYDYS